MLQKYIRIRNNQLYVYFINIKYQHWSNFLIQNNQKFLQKLGGVRRGRNKNHIRILQIKVIKIILEVISVYQINNHLA